jgi:hypothetical protein
VPELQVRGYSNHAASTAKLMKNKLPEHVKEVINDVKKSTTIMILQLNTKLEMASKLSSHEAGFC